MTLSSWLLIGCAWAQGRTAALQRKLKDLAEFVFVDAPHIVTAAVHCGSGTDGDASNVSPAATIRRAWLVADRQADVPGRCDGGAEQWRQQTAGWPESQAVIDQVLKQQGPFDGVLGFSQGAAVAAVLCAQEQQQRCHFQQQQQQQQPPSAGARPALRFAILCSGYPSAAAGHRCLHADMGLLQLPTLHVFASRAHGPSAGDASCSCRESSNRARHACGDQQVDAKASHDLLELCEPRLRYVVEHQNGHIIPVDKGCIQRFRSFLEDVAAG